jgi:pimeloyl-ACP methyl ester carboxylesterase
MQTGKADIWDEVQHGFADNNGVKIHFATIGKGPLVVMIHGFPDFWYTWRHQMNALKSEFKVVAIDQRGYNQSDQPSSPEAYDMRHLVSDVAAVIRHHNVDSANVVGHDWGGAVAWQFAFSHPEMTRNLVILNLPHPNGLLRELTNNKEQRLNSAYTQAFKKGSASDADIFFGRPMTPENLAGWVSDPNARKRYVSAFEKSSFDAMLQFYKRNYPDLPKFNAAIPLNTPTLKCPTLMFHGLKDQALHSDGLNHTWDWIDADFTLVTVPNADHFVQNDAPEKVSRTLQWWLLEHH